MENNITVNISKRERNSDSTEGIVNDSTSNVETKQGDEASNDCNESADTDSDEVASSVQTIEELSEQMSTTEALQEVVKQLSVAIDEYQNNEGDSMEDTEVDMADDNESMEIQDTGIPLTALSETRFPHKKNNNTSFFDSVTLPGDKLIINTIIMDATNQFSGTDKVSNIMEIIDNGDEESILLNKTNEISQTKPSAPPPEDMFNETTSTPGGSDTLTVDTISLEKEGENKPSSKKSPWNDFLRKLFRKKKVNLSN